MCSFVDKINDEVKNIVDPNQFATRVNEEKLFGFVLFSLKKEAYCNNTREFFSQCDEKKVTKLYHEFHNKK